MFTKVKDSALLSVFVLCGYVLGWIWTWFTNVPMIHNFIDDGYYGFPTIDWAITLMCVGLGIGSLLIKSNLRTKLILSAFNITALAYWWLIEKGTFDVLFPSITSVLYIGASILTGLALVTLIAFIGNMTKARGFLVIVIVLMSALTPMVINTLVEPEPVVITAIENVRPENFQLIATPESGKAVYLFEEYSGNDYSSYSAAIFQYENASWIYYWPVTGNGSHVPWKSEFKVPVRLEGGNTIWGNAWVDEIGVWMDLSVFNKDTLDV